MANFFLSSAYVLGLHWLYVAEVVPIWSYMGYKNVESYGLSTLLLAGAATALVATALPRQLTRPSTAILWILYLFVIVPIAIIPFYVLDSQSGYEIYLITALLCCLILTIASRAPRISIPQLVVFRKSWLMPLFAFITIAGLYLLALSTLGLTVRVSSIIDVYEGRLEVGDILSGLPIVITYLLGWVRSCVNPALIAYGLIKRRYLYLAIGFFGQTYFFLATGHKTTLFSIPFLLGLYWLCEKFRQSFGAMLVSAVLGISALSYLIDKIVDSGGLIVSLIIRRTIATPGLLSAFYFEYFSTHPQALLSYATLEGISPPRYILAPPKTIAEEYFHSANMAANANFLADGFANFGIIGMLLMTTFLSLFLIILNSLAITKRQILFTTLLIAYPAFALINSGLFTSLLTHGLLPMTVIVYLLRNRIQ